MTFHPCDVITEAMSCHIIISGVFISTMTALFMMMWSRHLLRATRGNFRLPSWLILLLCEYIPRNIRLFLITQFYESIRRGLFIDLFWHIYHRKFKNTDFVMLQIQKAEVWPSTSRTGMAPVVNTAEWLRCWRLFGVVRPLPDDLNFYFFHHRRTNTQVIIIFTRSSNTEIQYSFMFLYLWFLVGR